MQLVFKQLICNFNSLHNFSNLRRVITTIFWKGSTTTINLMRNASSKYFFRINGTFCLCLQFAWWIQIPKWFYQWCSKILMWGDLLFKSLLRQQMQRRHILLYSHWTNFQKLVKTCKIVQTSPVTKVSVVPRFWTFII